MTVSEGFFVTGTDTGVGKTWIAVALIQTLKQRGLSALGMKPVASGCEPADGELRNHDALLLQANASFLVPYRTINPYSFAPPIAPHIAAEQAGIRISLETIRQSYNTLHSQADCVVVEGVGGWEVPLNPEQRVSHLAITLGLPVILVVGLRLGCLNHALLTHAAIKRSGLSCAGWVANQIEPDYTCLSENVRTLRDTLDTPLLGLVPYQRAFEPRHLANCLSAAHVADGFSRDYEAKP